MVGIHSIQVGLSWMGLIVSFVMDGTLPEDKSEVEKIRRKAPRYWSLKISKGDSILNDLRFRGSHPP